METFARANGGEAGFARPIIGLALLSVVPEVLRAFYEPRLHALFDAGTAWEHDYECSSPSLRRRFRMRALPVPGLDYAIVSHARLVETPVDDVSAQPLAAYVSSSGIITQCAHCRRVQRRDGSGAWDFVPELVRAPREDVSHGLCALCLEYHYGGSG